MGVLVWHKAILHEQDIKIFESACKEQSKFMISTSWLNLDLTIIPSQARKQMEREKEERKKESYAQLLPATGDVDVDGILRRWNPM